MAAFPKLRSGSPYTFDHWADDTLYYRVSKRPDGYWNCKRLPLTELRTALAYMRATAYLDRAGFAQSCPIAHRDGDCGFCVAGRLLERLGLARYSGQGNRFDLTDAAKADDLLRPRVGQV